MPTINSTTSTTNHIGKEMPDDASPSLIYSENIARYSADPRLLLPLITSPSRLTRVDIPTERVAFGGIVMPPPDPVPDILVVTPGGALVVTGIVDVLCVQVLPVGQIVVVTAIVVVDTVVVGAQIPPA